MLLSISFACERLSLQTQYIISGNDQSFDTWVHVLEPTTSYTGGGGLPINPIMLLILGAGGAAVVIIIIVIAMKKRVAKLKWESE